MQISALNIDDSSEFKNVGCILFELNRTLDVAYGSFITKHGASSQLLSIVFICYS